MIYISYKNQEDNAKIKRNVMLIHQRYEQYNQIKSNQMPKGYDINDLKFDLIKLSEWIDIQNFETVGTSLCNILYFLGEFYDISDPQDISTEILDVFNESGFMNNTFEILKNDNQIQDIIYLFEILCRIFKIVSFIQDDNGEDEVHPIQKQITDDLLLEISRIVKDPKSILPEELQNTFELGNTSITSLFATIDSIPVDQYYRIINLGIAAISNLCTNNNDLLNFTYEKICPALYDIFIKNGEGNPDTVFEIVRLFLIIITYFNFEILVDEMKPFIALFVHELFVDEEITLLSIRGICQCMSRNPGIADEFPKTSLFEQINKLLEQDNEDIQNDTIILITETFCRGSRSSREELAKHVNWELIRDIGFNKKYIKVHNTICIAIPKIIEYSPYMTNIIFDSQIIHAMISICTNSTFEVKVLALHSFLDIVPNISSVQIGQLIEEEDLFSEFISVLNDFLMDVDDQTTIQILKTLSYIFKVGTEISIIQKLNKQNFFENIKQNVMQLQDSDNGEIMKTAMEFLDDIETCEQELEEACETGNL